MGQKALESISDYQTQELNRLKTWLYGRCLRTKVEKDRAERREGKEQRGIKKKEEQPALFEF